jgi:hypothetical protein
LIHRIDARLPARRDEPMVAPVRQRSIPSRMKPLLLALAMLAADPAPEPDPAAVDVADAIGCKLDAPTYTGFALALASGGPDAPDAKKGWRKVDSHNPYMNEYALPAPITVAGHYSTTHIGFTASGWWPSSICPTLR